MDEEIFLPELLTPKELAQKLKISTATIYVWASRGILPVYDLATPGEDGEKKRGCIRFNEAEVKEWLKKRYQPGK